MNQKEKRFVKTVLTHYDTHGRHTLPWRTSITPYKILVSEIMLQQTQVDRVIPKYKAFLQSFPSFKALAAAPQRTVLAHWSGLGYNRRALNLHKLAEIVSEEHKGRLPKTYEGLVELPGIGPYTAGAIMAFAHNLPHPIIETNIRTVFIHHFFRHTKDVSDADILKLVEKTLDQKSPQKWYWALMDYGAHLKKEYGNNTQKSRSYVKQKPFKDSDRAIRGAILKLLLDGPKTTRALQKEIPQDDVRIATQLEALMREGFISKKGHHWLLV
jgi:A/G-specific adenine glycosylase